MGRNSIKARLLKSFLTVILVALLITAIFLEVAVIALKDISLSSNAEAGTKAAENSELLLTEQAIASAGELIETKTTGINQEFNNIIKLVNSTADYISYMYNNKELYSDDCYVKNLIEYEKALKESGEWDAFVATPELTMHWLWNDYNKYLKNKTDIDSELMLIANLEGYLSSVMNTYDDMISTIYLTSTAIGDVDGGDYYNVGYDKALAIKCGLFEGVANPGMNMENSIFLRDWYKIPIGTGEVYVSQNPDDDMFGRGKVVTVCKAYYEGEGESRVCKGVFSVDMYTNNISETILQTAIGNDGFALLCSVNRDVEGSNKIDIIASQNDNEKCDLSVAFGSAYTEIAQGIKEMKLPASGYYSTEIDGQMYYAIFDKVENVNWVMVAMMSADEMSVLAKQSADAIGDIMSETRSRIDNSILIMNLVLIAVFILIIVSTVFVTRNVCRNITAPIVQLEQNVKKIGNGELDYKSKIHTGDEVESLSQTFERMTVSLKNYINDLNKVTADKERIATELNVATQIQASMLPCIFPPFPEMQEFDIYATMQPAKEVGGDFYDFFLIDKTHLGFVIADVSGKGVPAALFMVIAKTLIKNHAQAGKGAAEVFTTVNAQLCENNEAGMFVTGWMGIMEIETGQVTFVNAGHNPPLIKKAGGKYEYLKSKAGFVLAGMEGIKYKQFEFKLDDGDRIFLYTDGVTEATDPDNMLFGEDRLKTVLDDCGDIPVSEVLPMVKSEIDKFVRGRDQFDDITMLSVKYKGSHNGKGE